MSYLFALQNTQLYNMLTVLCSLSYGLLSAGIHGGVK